MALTFLSAILKFHSDVWLLQFNWRLMDFFPLNGQKSLIAAKPCGLLTNSNVDCSKFLATSNGITNILEYINERMHVLHADCIWSHSAYHSASHFSLRSFSLFF